MRIRTGVLVCLACAALALPGCASPLSAPPPTASGTGASATGTSATGEPTIEVDYAALEKSIEASISSGSAGLDTVRAVLVVVDGQTKIAHYRHGFTADEHAHIFSVTKSVVSTLIGIAIADGLISDLDQPLSALLPDHRAKMTPSVAKVTLRDLMTMGGGFAFDPPDDAAAAIVAGKIDLVDWAVSEGQESAAGVRFGYSNVSAHLAAAVLLDALRRNPSTRDQTVLDYARTKLFDPLGIVSRPAYEGFPVDNSSAFDASDFAWMRIGDLHLGGFGLRLTATDLAKLGQLYADDGVWQGTRLLPAGWVEQATAPSQIATDYGLFWWIDNQWGMPLFVARGAFGQRIAVVPGKRIVVVTIAAPMAADDATPIDSLVNDVILRALQ